MKIDMNDSFFPVFILFRAFLKKTLCVFVLFAFTVSGANSWAIDQEVIKASDGKAHIALSALGTVAIHSGLRAKGLGKWEALITSVVAMAFIGVTKEVTDSKVTERDLRADSYGIGLGASIVIAVDWF